jgi:hypothetical protein
VRNDIVRPCRGTDNLVLRERDGGVSLYITFTTQRTGIALVKEHSPGCKLGNQAVTSNSNLPRTVLGCVGQCVVSLIEE